MKKILIALLLLCVPGLILAQQRDPKKEYEEFKRQAGQHYADFREKANGEYAEFMRRAWQEFKVEPALPVPMKPQPPKQPVCKPDEKPVAPKPLPYDVVVTVDPDVVQPQPLVPIPAPVAPVTQTLTVDLFGAQCTVRVDPNAKIRMTDSSEGGVATAWQQLSDGRFNALLTDCLQVRQELQLCDWAYFQLAQKAAAACYGAENSREAVVLQAYILTQSGYKVRMARADGNLTPLLPSDVEIYGYPYLSIDGDRYYVLDPAFRGQGLYICDFAFPGEQTFSLYINRQPLFPAQGMNCGSFKSARYPQAEVTVGTNRNLIDFYNTYPQCRWDVYALASLSPQVKQTLYPVLKQSIAGKSEAEAANLLVNFMQTAFEYRTDAAQFGRERSLFPDETFHFPYSDCEDRAILYATLVRELLGLHVALLYYPDHLATAVHFNDEVSGDYLTVGGRKYIVCDPTFENANIGRTMPGMNNQTAEVIVLK